MIIFNPAALGDVLLTTPFIRQLKKKSGSKITYIVSNYAKVMLNKNPYLDKVETVDINGFKNPFFLMNFFLRYFSLSRETVFVLRKHWFFVFIWRLIRPFGKIVAFNKYSFPLPAKTIKYPKKYFDKHEIFYYLDLLKPVGIKPDYSDWKMDFFGVEKFDFKKYNIRKPYTVFVPGAGNPADPRANVRRYPLSYFINLSKKEPCPIFVGSKKELIYKEDICKGNSRAIILFGDLNIGQVAFLLKHAEKVITNDTGLMHLASAMDSKNILSLFTITSPIKMAPLNKGSRYIKKGDPREDLYG